MRVYYQQPQLQCTATAAADQEPHSFWASLQMNAIQVREGKDRVRRQLAQDPFSAVTGCQGPQAAKAQLAC
jgi:hypothetical protein